MPIVSRALAHWDRPNFQVAIDVVAGTRGRGGWATGDVGLPRGLAELARGSPVLTNLETSALDHVTVPLGAHEGITCVVWGFWLVRDPEGPLVVMLKSADRGMGEDLGSGSDACSAAQSANRLSALARSSGSVDRNVPRTRFGPLLQPVTRGARGGERYAGPSKRRCTSLSGAAHSGRLSSGVAPISPPH
jgi:hypothetical protein